MAEIIDFNSLKKRMSETINVFTKEISGLRTGRASTRLLDPIMVDAYGSLVPLNQVANVSVAETRMLSVSVWDKSMVGAVERAIRESKLGINPITDGTNLRLPLPELNEERRKELIKVAHQYAEQARIAIRHIRRDGMDSLKKAEKQGEIGQDESRSDCDKVQKLTEEMISEIDKLLLEKEKEIMQI